MGQSVNDFTKPVMPRGLPDVLQGELESRWASYLAAAQTAGVRVPGQVGFRQRLASVLVQSEFVTRQLAGNPGMLPGLLDSGDLLADSLPGEIQRRLEVLATGCSTDQGLGRVLRDFRNREMVRIAFRDLAGWAPVEEVLTDLSQLADACIRVATAKLYAWHCALHGTPKDRQGRSQPLIVIGMGKLGAAELNFSSDIDLIFAYPEAGFVRKRGKLDLESFFTALGRRLIAVLGDTTANGFVYRVDMRLRPFGDAGPLVMDFAMLEEYYQAQGREWERYALIKARAITGDTDNIVRWEALLAPFVYRRYLDFGSLGQLRDMKAMIMREAARHGLERDIKLGPGGIREVEFIVQAFQLIRGGREPQLRERGLLRVLQALADMDLLPDFAARRLAGAYRFLRRVENRLQAVADQQTHRLPGTEADRARLAYSMGSNDWEAFSRELDGHRQFVNEQFQQVFGAPQLEAENSPDQRWATLWQDTLSQEEALARLAESGFAAPAEAWQRLQHTRQGIEPRLGQLGRRRLDRLMPLLLAAVSEAADPDATLGRLLLLIETIAGRSAYLALLVEHPLALSQLVRLCDASPWIATQLTRHPILLDELPDPRTLYHPPGREVLAQQLGQRLQQLEPDDLEQQMDVLRQFKQAAVLRVAAADVAGAIPLTAVSDYLTVIAEVVLAQVLDLAWQYMLKRHGRPLCRAGRGQRQPGFTVIGYGKLGGLELGYGSDLDLVFLHDSAGEEARSDGKKPLDNAVYFARLGQRVIHLLNTLTPSGMLYEVDMRLRPSGASGLLVTSLEAFRQYQRQEAWTWEHQALVRARPVAGDAGLAEGFARVREDVLRIRRDAGRLRSEVRDMRERMRAELGSHKPGLFDLKQDRGGIADIEFMVQYDILRWAYEFPDLTRFSDNLRLLDALAGHALLSTEDATILGDAYRAYRKRGHQLALQESPAQVEDWEFVDTRQRVSALWSRLMLDELSKYK